MLQISGDISLRSHRSNMRWPITEPHMETETTISYYNLRLNVSDNGVTDDSMTSYMTYKIGEILVQIFKIPFLDDTDTRYKTNVF